MAQITLNEAGIQRFLQGPLSPVVRDLERRAQNVAALATRNAGGVEIGIESGDLHTGIHYEIEHRPEGPVAVIKTDAMDDWHGRPFSYPAYHDQNGRPWLTSALRDGFDL